MTSAHLDAQVLRALRFDPTHLLTISGLTARIEGLRAAGYRIEGDSAGSYRLISAPCSLIADDIAASMPERTLIGREIIVLAETHSTNDLAAQAGRDGAAEGLVIFAESQRAGRGRLNRKWISPPGKGLLFSVLLRPERPPAEWPQLTFCAALAVANAVEAFCSAAVTIKWPNDVLVNGRKIAGILLETHQKPTPYVVLGIGLNVLQTKADFPVELQERVTSLAIVDGFPLDRRAVAAGLLSRLEEVYRAWKLDFTSIKEECVLRGCVVTS